MCLWAREEAKSSYLPACKVYGYFRKLKKKKKKAANSSHEIELLSDGEQFNERVSSQNPAHWLERCGNEGVLLLAS